MKGKVRAVPLCRPATYAEYPHAVKAGEDAVREHVTLRQRISELEQRLMAVELKPDHLDACGSDELARLANHYHKLLTAIIEEWRARHHDIAEELIAPRVHALEAELAAAKERVWEVR